MATHNLLDSVAAVRAASRQMVRELGFMQNRFGDASAAQCHALVELEQHGMLTTGELAELLAVDKSTASRTAKGIVARRWAKMAKGRGDRRKRPIALTAAGRRELRHIHQNANAQVEEALALLAPAERQRVLSGIELYARALARRRRQREFRIRPIRPSDDAEVAKLIRRVMPEFGASGAGFAINDPEVDRMSRAYRSPRSRYWVVERAGRIVGAGGFAPLARGGKKTAELRKMYFLPETRGVGLGKKLLALCLDEAKRAGFQSCYLETLANMTTARRLYSAFGFVRLSKPKGRTGHFGCNAWYQRRL